MADLKHVTDDSFDAEVLSSDRPVLVDFWAEWCGPCRLVEPHLKAIADERDDLRVVKVHLDQNPMTATKYGVMSIPTMMLFVDGVEKARLVGARPKQAILTELEAFLQQPA